MATQIDKLRKYTTVEEGVTKTAVKCPLCKVRVVPRGVTSTRYGSIDASQEDSCPNCGHVFGRANH